MFRIGEFSRLTQVSIRMLRYYDETGLLKPQEIDRFTNYRSYTADQIPQLNRIIFLRDLDFNIAEIAVILAEWKDDFILSQLENKYREIKDNIASEKDKLLKIEQAKKDIHSDRITINNNVTIKAVPAYQVFSLRRIVPDYYAEGQLWQEMSTFAKENNISITQNTFTIYHDTDYREKEVDIEVCAPIEIMGEDREGFTYREIEAVPFMAGTMVYGDFVNIAKAYRAFAGWLTENQQYKMSGPSRQIVHRGPWNENDPEKYLTEIQIPLLTLT